MAFQTYQATTDREGLMDALRLVGTQQAPVYDALGKVTVESVHPEWVTDDLATASADNAVVEGAAYTFASPAAKTRVGNYTQIFEKTWKISRSQESVAQAGVTSEDAHQLKKKMLEIKRDIDKALIQGTSASGASGTARTMSGILEFVATNTETGTGSGSETLTEDMLGDLLQTVYLAGGVPDTLLTNVYQKRQIAGFSAASTRNIDADERKLIRNIEVYESEVNVLRIMLDPQMVTTSVAALTMDEFKVGVLKGQGLQRDNKVVANGHYIPGAIFTEMTLISYNEKASGEITQLSTS